MVPATDDALRALAHPDRRRLLAALLDADGWLPVREAVADVRREERRLRTALYHNHLPRLEAAGFVRWDDDANRVAPGPRFEEIERLADLLCDGTDDLVSHE